MSEISTRRTFAGIFACAYPVAAHIAVTRGSVRWAILAIALLAAAALLPALLRGRALAWLSLAALALGCWWLEQMATPAVLLYVAPVLVPAFLAWLFGHTLFAGRTPLIAQIIRVLHRDGIPPDPAVWLYARRLTLTWTIFLAALASANLTLAALAEPAGLLLAAGLQPPVTVPRYWWSLFANVIGYVLVATFFGIEYAYRVRRFPQQPYRNIVEFARRVGAIMPQLLRSDANTHRRHTT